MIKHVFKILWNERKHNIIIVLELLIISLILWSVMDKMYCRTRNYLSPTGFNIENTFLVQLKEVPFISDEYVEGFETAQKVEAVREIFSRIERDPGVQAASLSIASRPGSPGNITPTAYSHRFEKRIPFFLRSVTPGFLDVYGYEPVTGEREALKKILEKGGVIVTEDFDKVSLQETGESILGDSLYYDSEFESPIGVAEGLVKPIRYTKYMPAGRGVVVVNLTNDFLAQAVDGWISGIEISIRVQPDLVNEFAKRFEKEIAPQMEIGNFRFQHILYNPDQFEYEAKSMKNAYLSDSLMLIFLVANILLGVAGVFWYRTAYRRSQIGLRISFGSTPSGAQRFFLIEGVLLQAIAMLGAVIIMAIIFTQDILSVSLIPLDIRRYVGGFILTSIIMLGGGR